MGRIDLWIMGLRVKVVYLIFCHSGRCAIGKRRPCQHFLIIVVLLMKENFVAVNFYSEFYREWFRKKNWGEKCRSLLGIMKALFIKHFFVKVCDYTTLESMSCGIRLISLCQTWLMRQSIWSLNILSCSEGVGWEFESYLAGWGIWSGGVESFKQNKSVIS